MAGRHPTMQATVGIPVQLAERPQICTSGSRHKGKEGHISRCSHPSWGPAGLECADAKHPVPLGPACEERSERRPVLYTAAQVVPPSRVTQTWRKLRPSAVERLLASLPSPQIQDKKSLRRFSCRRARDLWQRGQATAAQSCFGPSQVVQPFHRLSKRRTVRPASPATA